MARASLNRHWSDLATVRGDGGNLHALLCSRIAGCATMAFERLRVVGRGVDTLRFGPRWRSEEMRRHWEADGPVLLYVGRLAAEKNVGLTLRAFDAARRLVPSLKMVVVGDGPQRSTPERSFPQARFVGAQRGKALARDSASADLLAFPSLSDTFGNVTLEALASGLPVIAFDTAAAGEHVRDGVSGRLLPRGDEIGSIDAACQLIQCRADLAGLRTAARKAARRPDWNTVMLSFELRSAVGAP